MDSDSEYVQQKGDLDTLSLPSVCKSCKLDKQACSCADDNIVKDPSDPDKIWAILHYPDALKISHKMLCGLLQKLREYDDEVCLSEFQWTLAARVNCADDDPSQGVQISSDTPPPCTDCKGAAICTSNGTLESSVDTSAPTNGYFCVTAPVKAHKGTSFDDEKNPHYVCKYTHTIVVDLRYNFRANINVPKCNVPKCNVPKCNVPKCKSLVSSISYLNNIAEKVQEIVASFFEITGNTKFRVYVLKPQHQTYCGVSPSSSPRAGTPS